VPRPHSGAPGGGSARESENDPAKRNVPPWRNCFPRTRSQRGNEGSSRSGNGTSPSVRLSRVRKRGPKNVRHDLARPETRPNRDAAGRDSSRGDDRPHRSARLAELKTGLQREGDRFGGGLCQAPRRHSRALGLLVRVCLALTCLQDRLGAERCNTVRLPIGR